MRVGWFLLLLFFCPPSLQAQFEFEANYQTSFSSHLNAAVHSGDETWVVGGQREINDIDLKPGIVFRMDSFGFVLWSHFVLQDTLIMGVSEVLDLDMFGDSTVLIAGRARSSCDDPPDHGFVQMLDTGGTLMWTEIYSTGPLEKITHLNDSMFIVAAGSSIMGINLFGDSLWSQDHGFGQINSLFATSNNELIAACTNGLYRADAQGDLIASRTTSTPILELEQLDASTYVHLTANRAVLSDTNFILLDSIQLDPYMQQVQHLEIQFGGFWCIGDSLSVLFDPNLNVGSLWPLDIVMGEETRDVAGSDTRLLFTGTLPSFQNRTSTVKTYSSHGDQEQNGQNMGVLDFNVDDLSYTLVPNPTEVQVDLELSIFLKNYGTAQNQFVRLNAILGDGDCTPEAIWDQVGGLALSPGDTGIAFKSVQLMVENMGANTEFDLCFWTTTPNGKRDRDWTNDEYCKTISVPVGVGIEEAMESGSNIWPNPTSDFLIIEGPGPSVAERPTIYDLAGRAIFTETNWNGVRYKIPVQHLEPGIYVIKFWIEGKYLSAKFLKE